MSGKLRVQSVELDKAHPELRGRLRWIPPLPFYSPLARRSFGLLSGLLSVVRKGFQGNDQIGVDRVDHGAAFSKVYRPLANAEGAAILWLHGGGFILGDVIQDDATCCRLVEALGVTVVSVNYRLAPQHPFPAALDDCLDSWCWLQDNAAGLGVDPDRVVIGGQSAGGGLAAALAQRLHDQGGVQPAGQLLFCPMLDDRTAARLELDGEKHFIWNNRSNRASWGDYLGQPAGQSTVPDYAVPARRDSLAGLPATWLGVGSIDLFAAEDVDYIERLRASGVDCELHLTEGGPHAFESFFPDASVSETYWQSAFDFLKRVLVLGR